MNVKGKTVCVTGVLAGLKRDEAEAGLTALGAKVVGSISKNCDILFVGAQAGSKLAKAKALGVTIADETELLAVLGNKTISKAKLAARASEEKERRKLEAQALAGKSATPSSLKDQTIVVTGTLSVQRDEMEEMLRRAGAKVSGSISKSTRFLVVGAGAGSKLAKAKELGVKTLTEAQVRAILGKTSGGTTGKSKPG
jgi:DNA ligase (NAD+)